jgi:hypothetical protein
MYQVFKRLFGEEDKKQRYVNGAYVLIVKFGKNNNRDDRKTCYSLFVRHGNGGGRRVGGKMNNLDDMAKICDADIYVMSHTHQPAAFRKGFSRTDYRNEKLQYCDKLFVLTNAYLFYGGYGERLGFDMPSTVYPIIYLDGESRYARCLV